MLDRMNKPIVLLMFVVWGGMRGFALSEEIRPVADPNERATWQWLLDRADAVEHVERDGKGEVKWVGFYDVEKQKGDFYRGSLTLDEAGRVTKLTFNKANFTNEDLQRLSSFTQISTLTAWHNGWSENKAEDKSIYSGAGLVHFKNHPLEKINFGGSFFNDEGMVAANTLPNLRELKVYHTRVTNAGVEALRGNQHLTYLNLGPQYSQKIDESCIEVVSTISNLEKLDLNEMLLSWDGGLKWLVGLRKLETLNVNDGYVSPDDLARLKEKLPEVTIFYTQADDKFLDRMRSRHANAAE